MRRGFGLLLVVAIVIAVAVGFLLPAVGRARSAAGDACAAEPAEGREMRTMGPTSASFTTDGGMAAGAIPSARAAGVIASNPATPAAPSCVVSSQFAGAPLALAVDSIVTSSSGASAWTYRDLADASPKSEGGYTSFDDTATEQYLQNPHGGYDTTTDQCGNCHGAHRSEGAYYLLRADSQDDACDYCHVGGSAHSGLVVYDLNSAGKMTTNGHTIGASAVIPDSSVAQWTEEITLETVDGRGELITETIRVRAYEPVKNSMYRLIRDHGHSDPAVAGMYRKVGPMALGCVSCHQVHNAHEQTWNSQAMYAMDNGGGYSRAEIAGYKLLKASPSGSTWGDPVTSGGYDFWPPEQVAHVPETTLTAGMNFDNERGPGASPGLQVLTDGSTVGRPMWIAQGLNSRFGSTDERLSSAAVNNAALSVWCADCHNLNIGGSTVLDHPELGYKSHSERTHPAPFVGGASGPGQCYSCHRSDLPPKNQGDVCSQCHYGTGNYRENRTRGEAEYVASDFPHSGENGGYKMLGSYSTNVDGHQPTVIDEDVLVTADNLDAVCVRCHWME